MTEPDGIGFEIDCLMLIEPDEPEDVNEIWAQAEINVLTNELN